LQWISALILVSAAALAWPSSVHAQDLGSCKSNRQWTIEQISKNHYKLKGEVEIDCGDQSFAADEIELFEDTHKMIATGDVVFTSGNNRIAADRLEYNTQTKTGIFYNATGTAVLKESRTAGQPEPERDMFGTSEPDIYFYGKTLEKVGDRKYKITSGGFTTCVQPTPRWNLTAGTVVLNLDQHALLTNSLFRVKGVPVLYLPVFYYFINDEDRATGFLIPTYGASSVRGNTLSNAFFWAISRNQDATFLHDWYSRTGQGVGGEYRYVATPGSDGILKFYNLREHEATFDDGGSTVTTPERRSYEIRGTMSQRLSRTFRARARADYFSDITVQQTYNQNVFDASRRTRVYSGSVSGTLGSWNLTGATSSSTAPRSPPSAAARRRSAPPVRTNRCSARRRISPCRPRPRTSPPSARRPARRSTTGCRAWTSCRVSACPSRSGSS
jgi:lipopolysaccharide assembly outer membrane protein LptD (OstA)